MKILHVLWSGEFGGIEKVVYELACEQKKNGLQPTLLMGQRSGDFYPRAVNNGIEVLPLSLRHGWDFNPWVIYKTLRWMLHFDLIHFHALEYPYAAAAALSGRPIVISDHGYDLTANPYSLKRRVKAFGRSQFARRKASAVIANSCFTRELSIKMLGVPESMVVVVHNGIDFKYLKPKVRKQETRANLGISPQDFVIGTVCRLVKKKRIERLLSALCKMQYRSFSSILIVGDGPERNKIMGNAKSFGIAKQMIITGFRPDVPDLLNAMDVFVLPSQGEPFGIAALEAMAVGLPVYIFRDSGGALELQQDSKYIAEDDLDLAMKLDSSYANRGYPHPIPNLNLFSISEMTKKVSCVYNEVMINLKTAG